MGEANKRFVLIVAGLVAVALPSPAPAATWTFSNTDPITIPGPGEPAVDCDTGASFVACRKAAPYPAPIEVSTVGGTITDVEVTISGLSHVAQTFNLAVVVSGPETMQRSLMLMDCAGSNSPENLTFTFDDSAPAQLPDGFTNPNPVTSGAWRPTAHCTGENFPSPGPGTSFSNPGPAGGGTATLASAFNNTGPDGEWGLYVLDFTDPPQTGSIAGGWSLKITTSAPAEPTLDATDPPSPANENDLLVTGSAPAGTTVRLYDGCPFQEASDEVGSGTAAELASPGIPVTVQDNSSNTFIATAEEPGVAGSNCSNAVDFTEDSDAPETTLTDVPPNRTSKRKLKFGFEADEPGATFKCKLDAARFKPCDSPKAVKLDPGRHRFAVRATDLAGNSDPIPAEDAFKVVR